MNPALSVCIPTYRRPDQLRHCVESIVRSAGAHAVPIVVADDSTDDTNVAVLRELQGRYPAIEHHRNATNLGIDRNILHSVDLCRTRYAWILGEDDRMTPEGIPTVLAALATRAPPFLFVNYASIDEDVSMILSERSIALDADTDMDAAAFLARHAWSAGFIGACVVDRELWGTVRPERYVGTWFAHAGVILESVVGRRVHLLARPLVLNRCGSARAFTWTGSTFDVLGGWARMVDLLRTVYPAAACDEGAASFTRAHGIGSAAFFGYLRADRALDAAAWDAHVRTGPYPAASRRMAWWIARTPPVLFQAARWALTRFRRARNRPLEGYGGVHDGR
jgi:hypothetical protein